jgi:hypothetical protein
MKAIVAIVFAAFCLAFQPPDIVAQDNGDQIHFVDQAVIGSLFYAPDFVLVKSVPDWEYDTGPALGSPEELNITIGLGATPENGQILINYDQPFPDPAIQAILPYSKISLKQHTYPKCPRIQAFYATYANEHGYWPRL